MFELQRLRLDHEDAVLGFELANRAYFAESISDRGDDFFEKFDERYRAFLAEQDAGRGSFHVLVDEDGTLMGRFNLYDIVDGTAEVGYRVAQRFSGRGVATSGLRSLCSIAREECGLRTLLATASNANVASRRVLAKAGFVASGPVEIEGRQGVRYELVLASGMTERG
jgi:[ribosomal protein S5]-alanine N-acetyltransferase